MNLKTEKNLLFRILTASIAVPLVLGLVYFSWNSFWLFCTLLTLAGIYEFLKLSGLDKSKTLLIPALLPALSVWVSFLFHPHPQEMSTWILCGILGGLVISMMLILFDSSINQPFQTLALLNFSGVYVFLPFALFYRLSYDFTGNYNFYIPLGILLLVWCSDTLAYVAGRLMGKRKLMPSVSPSKTIEGAVGGFICTLVLAVVLQEFWSINLIDWRAIGLIIAITCPLGDLVESRLKRALEVKDSGGLLPGHGGLLDRFDGFLLSLPVVYLYLFVTGSLQSFIHF
jgi:phosphatidate cytidylyltransferase